MRKLLMLGCLAVSATLCSAGMNTAQADHGRGGYHRAPSCGYGAGNATAYRGYRGGYSPYGRVYATPSLSLRSAYSVGQFGYGVPRGYGYGFGSPYRVGYGGGYGNLGYGSPYGLQNRSGLQLRIGF